MVHPREAGKHAWSAHTSKYWLCTLGGPRAKVWQLSGVMGVALQLA